MLCGTAPPIDPVSVLLCERWLFQVSFGTRKPLVFLFERKAQSCATVSCGSFPHLTMLFAHSPKHPLAVVGLLLRKSNV